MIFLDPPDHTRLRTLVSRAFTPRRIGELEDRIRELCRDFLDAAGPRGAFDYVQDFGARLPAMVIASLLGVPLEDQNRGARAASTRSSTSSRASGMINDVSFGRQIELHGYLGAQLEASGRRTPRRHAHRPRAGRDRRRRRRRPAGSPSRRAPTFANLLDQRRHRDGRPAAGLGGGACSTSTPTSGPSWPPTRRSSRTRSRSCCATRRRRRCRGAGPPREVERARQRHPGRAPRCCC